MRHKTLVSCFLSTLFMGCVVDDWPHDPDVPCGLLPGDECEPPPDPCSCDADCVDLDDCCEDCEEISCGGITGGGCPDGLTCVDDPGDDCDPEMGGADCIGICVEEPEVESCSLGEGDCAEDEYCEPPLFAACDDPMAKGTCVPRPEVCILIYDPVCGCDGKTYGNACEAAAAGVNIAFAGKCEDEPADDRCGGLLGLACDEGEYCKYKPRDLCGAADATGTCKPIPDACIEIYDPVCGCDDETYGNACLAAAEGVSVASEGPCDEEEPVEPS